ncbi:MAG TPA: glycosyltransferase family 39 protein [Bauldia sp.]|nr:glycosyltransferase family 39 protein [Bauldia sp.]
MAAVHAVNASPRRRMISWQLSCYLPCRMLAAEIERIGLTVARSPRASLAVIFVVALACMLPGFATMAPLDGDEPGYAVAAREMVATNDYATVRLQTEETEWRPRGAYWIQAFFMRIAGPSPPIWVARLPSLAAGVGAAMLTWWMAMAFAAPVTALIAGLFVAASGIVGLEARLATPDAILLAATTLCGGALARLWLKRNGRPDDLVALVFWTGLGLAVLAKGWIAPAIVLAAIAILSLERGTLRWTMQLRPGLGAVWLFLLVSPWLIAVALTLLQGITDSPSLQYLVSIGVPFQLQAPPGSYALILPLLAGPAATFIFTGLPWFATELRRPVVFFALAWGGPLWLAAELVDVKEPQWVLPAIPAVVLLAAAAIDAGKAKIGGRISWFYSLGPLLWPPLVALIVPAIFLAIEDRFPWFAAAAFAVAAILGPVTWFWLHRGLLVAAALMSVATVFFIYLGFFGSFVPGLSGLRIGEQVAALARGAQPCTPQTFAAAGYPEESLVYTLGPDTRLVDAWSAADFLNTAGCRIAIVDVSQISAFRQRAEDLGLALVDRGHVSGFDLRKMRVVDVHLFVAGGGAP